MNSRGWVLVMGHLRFGISCWASEVGYQFWGIRGGVPVEGHQRWGTSSGASELGYQFWGIRGGVPVLGHQRWGTSSGASEVGYQLWGIKSGASIVGIQDRTSEMGHQLGLSILHTTVKEYQFWASKVHFEGISRVENEKGLFAYIAPFHSQPLI